MDNDQAASKETQIAMDTALRWLAARARSRAEMQRYLKRKGYAGETAAMVIARLESLGYLDDAQYAAMLVRDRVNLKGAGRRAIVLELKEQGIDAETVAEALGQYSPEEELEAARRQGQKAMRSARDQDARKRRTKVYANLARHGFSTDIIQRVLNELFISEPDNTEF